MTLKEATDIVIELAMQGALDDNQCDTDELREESDRQLKAIKLVETTLRNL